MTEYTPEDFANAGFAVNVDGRRAVRMAGGHWRTSKAELYPHAVLTGEAGWRPVHESAPLTLDTLREAWENAEIPTEGTPIREGDEVIVKHLEEGWEWVAICPGLDSGDWIPDARVLHRAPQPEPWQDLADVLGGVMLLDGVTPGRVRGIAQNLHERGVRVTGDRR